MVVRLSRCRVGRTNPTTGAASVPHSINCNNCRGAFAIGGGTRCRASLVALVGGAPRAKEACGRRRPAILQFVARRFPVTGVLLGREHEVLAVGLEGTNDRLRI